MEHNNLVLFQFFYLLLENILIYYLIKRIINLLIEYLLQEDIFHFHRKFLLELNDFLLNLFHDRILLLIYKIKLKEKISF